MRTSSGSTAFSTCKQKWLRSTLLLSTTIWAENTEKIQRHTLLGGAWRQSKGQQDTRWTMGNSDLILSMIFYIRNDIILEWAVQRCWNTFEDEIQLSSRLNWTSPWIVWFKPSLHRGLDKMIPRYPFQFIPLFYVPNTQICTKTLRRE